MLRISSGIDQLGPLNWDLALCLFVAWVICYFCIWKGTKSTGKVSVGDRRECASFQKTRKGSILSGESRFLMEFCLFSLLVIY